jgi:hypothetical protein
MPRHNLVRLFIRVSLCLSCNCEQPTLVVGEVVLHRANGQLLLEPIDLVQEEDYRRLYKPSRVADGVKQRKRFLHTVDRLVFEEELVVLRNGNQEEDCRDVLEAMYPLLSFRSLTTDVEHAVGKVANDKGRLSDTGGLYTRAQHILVVGNVVWCRNAVNRVEVACTVSQRNQTKEAMLNSLFRRIVQLVLARSLEALLHASILPEHRNGIPDLWRQAVAFNLCGLHEDGLNVVLGALVIERQLQGLHSLEDDAHRLHRVAEDDLLEGFPLVARVAALVDELHLLENGRLAGFTSTCCALEALSHRGDRTDREAAS